MAAKQAYKLNFVGDVMLGRLIDQMFPVHAHNPEEANIVTNFKRNDPSLQIYKPETPWDNTLSMFKEADLNLINLETSVTSHPTPWPDKVFNYRMHPANIEALRAADIDYTSLANNHTLDFCNEGLLETIETLQTTNIQHAGVGRTAEEAFAPAVLSLPRGSNRHRIECFSASDHPDEWSDIPGFHLIDYSVKCREHLKQIVTARQTKPGLRVFSVHWGPNYSWNPADEIKSLAHFLIDECDVDIIHGHSSHHVQGVELYKGKLIIYGCGDFVDDYAVKREYRNDLSAIWRVVLEEADEAGLKLKSLEVYPTRIRSFRVQLLKETDSDHVWVRNRIIDLSKALGSSFITTAGDQGQLVLPVA